MMTIFNIFWLIIQAGCCYLYAKEQHDRVNDIELAKPHWYALGGVLFGFSWLFFLGAGAFWTFWGIAQYLKKNDYQATAFVTPVYNEIKPCKSSYSVGLSVSFY